jgi:ArsR family transcriptional regulator, arsenate/arsenite/antimonite-responsive transcriptional repressor
MAHTVAVLERCCLPVLQGRLRKAEAEQLASTFKAIADPARLRLLSFIAGQPSGEACVCHLTKPLGLRQPTVSHHLKVLYEAGLLDRDRRGTWVYYRIIPERLRALRDALATPRHKENGKGSGRRVPLAGTDPASSAGQGRGR